MVSVLQNLHKFIGFSNHLHCKFRQLARFFLSLTTSQYFGGNYSNIQNEHNITCYKCGSDSELSSLQLHWDNYSIAHKPPCFSILFSTAIRIFGNIFEFEQTCTISIIIHVTIGEPTTTCCIQLPQNTSKYNTSVHDGLDEIIQLIGYLQRAPHILGMQIQLALSPLEMPNHHNLQQLV
jgi:hypothetical protein